MECTTSYQLSSIALVYAELLSNIGQVTIIVSIEKPITSDTRAELSADKKLLRLFHDGQTVTLILPAQVAADAELQKPALDRKEMVWRLPLAQRIPANRGADFAESNPAPWPASKLSAETQINCRKCRSTIVQAQTVRTWKDLPSENWAEMMDFWHCHKPHDHQHDTANRHSGVENKGYGANTKFIAKPGVGFVDLTYFLLSEKDCTGAKVPYEGETLPSLVCATCSAPLGSFDSLGSGYRLYKWNLALPDLPTQQPAYPLSIFLAAHLLSQISSKAVHKFLLHCPSDPAAPILHIWIFQTRITISISVRPAPFPVTKIYYTTPSADSVSTLLQNTSKLTSAIAEVHLPADVMHELAATLDASTRVLPSSVRCWKEWQLGFLERWAEE